MVPLTAIRNIGQRSILRESIQDAANRILYRDLGADLGLVVIDYPRHQVTDALPGRLRARSPKLKILNPVVVTNAVFVMDTLILPKVSPEMLFHHKTMLHHRISGRLKRMVVGQDLNVPAPNL